MSGFFGGFGIVWIVAPHFVYLFGGSTFERAVLETLVGVGFLLASIAWSADQVRRNAKEMRES